MEYDTVLAQNLTTVAVLGLSVMLTYIAVSVVRYHSLGREALLCASTFVGTQAIIRTLSINDVIDSDMARLLVGVSALTSFAIIVQIAWLKHVDQTLRDTEEVPHEPVRR